LKTSWRKPALRGLFGFWGRDTGCLDPGQMGHSGHSATQGCANWAGVIAALVVGVFKAGALIAAMTPNVPHALADHFSVGAAFKLLNSHGRRFWFCVIWRIFSLELPFGRADTQDGNRKSSLNLFSAQQARISLPMLVI
jgi:hypothetical protein